MKPSSDSMLLSSRVKLVVFVPVNHADAVRRAMGEAGAGEIGNYSFCSFSSKGVGRFIAGSDANPFVGKVGKLESVPEERIEVVCDRENVSKIIAALKAVHPYEEVALDVYPLEDI